MNQRNQARRPARAAARLRILPYGPSDSVNALCTRLGEMGAPALKLSLNRSAFRGRNGDLVVNWGNSTMDNFDAVAGNARVLNPQAAIRKASMKTDAFVALAAAGVPTTEFTTERAVAQGWLEEGGVVYARTRLQGHSGEGIVVCTTQAIPDLGGIQVSQELVNAPLYTKGITAQRREFRVHVMGGKIIYTQQKKRSEGWRENENYSNVVRNYHTGWIYATENIQINNAGAAAAIESVAALGLDFGAVDIITRGDNAWVLEVNTAPGLQGTNLENYAAAIKAIFLGEEVVPVQRPEVDQEVQELAQEIAAGVVVGEFVEPVAPPMEPVVELQQEEDVAPQQPADQAFYVVEIPTLGKKTVAQYEADQESFYIIGWDIPLSIENVVILKSVNM